MFSALRVHVLQEVRTHLFHSLLCSASVNSGTWTSARSSVPPVGAVTPPEFLEHRAGQGSYPLHQN